jgi:ubiquitin conjugation factor E4 B
MTFPKEYGTITEFYFMLAEAIHYGYIPILKRGEDVDKMFRRLMDEKEKMHQSHPEFNQMKLEFENMQRFRMVYELTIYDRDLIKEINNFFKIQFEMIKKWGKFSEKECRLMQDPPSTIMRLLPEHFLTDMTDFYQYIFKHRADSIRYFLPEDAIAIFEMAVVIIRSPKAISNPYIGAKFIEVLSMIIYFEKDVNWLAHFAESEILVNFLMEALVQFFVEIEFSGRSGSMYYEKFHYRFDCSSIFKRFWKLKIFKEKFRELIGSEKVERFINCLLNDTSHCLEEGISKLSEIKAYETKIGSGEHPSEEEQKNHEKNQNICKANIQLSNECIWMVKQISDWAREAFNNEVFTARMASSLNFVLNKIVGPHCIELKVNKPSKYKFSPINLLSDLINIYTNLSSIDLFISAVAGDELFQIKNAQKASRILKKNRRHDESIGLNSFIDKITEISQSQETNEEEKWFEEAPEDFLCPIAYCFMKDPVKLPTSGNTVDRSTIKRILLNDEHDPFNRAPLTYAQVEDDIEMKQRIQKWLQQKRNGEVTDEEKREDMQDDNPPLKIQADEDSQMSVDSLSKKTNPPTSAHNVEMEPNFEDMSEEEQMKLAMEMSMKDFTDQHFK